MHDSLYLFPRLVTKDQNREIWSATNGAARDRRRLGDCLRPLRRTRKER